MTTTYNTQGQAIPGYVVDQLGKSLSKHEEVLTDLVTKVSADENHVTMPH